MTPPEWLLFCTTVWAPEQVLVSIRVTALFPKLLQVVRDEIVELEDDHLGAT